MPSPQGVRWLQRRSPQMPDQSKDVRGSLPPAMSPMPSARMSSGWGANTGLGFGFQHAGAPPVLAQQTQRTPRALPLWLAVAAATLFGLVFGIGATLGATSPASVPSGSPLEQETINVIQAVDPSVVQVQARSAGGVGGGGVGSGEILTTSGYIVTNSHVVHGYAIYLVRLFDGQVFPAQLVGDAPTEDLAVLRIHARHLKPITVGDSRQVRVGEYALALGSPLGLEQSVTSGLVSALNRQVNETIGGTLVQINGLIQTSAPINPGNSGGALVNLRGELIGIPTFGAVDPTSGVAANGIGFAIASQRMQTIVRQLTGGAA